MHPVISHETDQEDRPLESHGRLVRGLAPLAGQFTFDTQDVLLLLHVSRTPADSSRRYSPLRDTSEDPRPHATRSTNQVAGRAAEVYWSLVRYLIGELEPTHAVGCQMSPFPGVLIAVGLTNISKFCGHIAGPDAVALWLDSVVGCQQTDDLATGSVTAPVTSKASRTSCKLALASSQAAGGAPSVRTPRSQLPSAC